MGRVLVIVLLSLAGFAGCGYQPSTILADRNSPMPIAVSLWENRTGELGLAAMLRQALVRRLQQVPAVRLVEDTDKAPFRLTGELVAMRREAVAYDAHDRARELRYTVTVTVHLLREGKPVWRIDRYEMNETYPVGDDAVRTRSNRRLALERLCADLADDLVFRLMEYQDAVE